MAVNTSTSATIRGISYTKGKSFKPYTGAKGNANSEGTAGSAAALSTSKTYYFLKYATAADSSTTVKYPYLVGSSSSSALGWYTEAVFPYATYTVAYNANGGSGAPGSQTKTYGKNLTLSSTKPTRVGYEFLGWGTSASDTSVDYNPGATYSKNAGITLYAIWKILGQVRIYTSSGWKTTIPYIYTSNGWKQVIPYIYTSSGWK